MRKWKKSYRSRLAWFQLVYWTGKYNGSGNREKQALSIHTIAHCSCGRRRVYESPGEQGRQGVRGGGGGEEKAGSWIPKAKGTGKTHATFCNIALYFVIQIEQRGGIHYERDGYRDVKISLYPIRSIISPCYLVMRHARDTCGFIYGLKQFNMFVKKLRNALKNCGSTRHVCCLLVPQSLLMVQGEVCDKHDKMLCLVRLSCFILLCALVDSNQQSQVKPSLGDSLSQLFFYVAQPS